MPLSFILDTDIGTDVDDALALAFALRHPDLDLRAVTTVSGNTTRRARMAKKLLLLAGRADIEVAAGVRGQLSQPMRNSEIGHEDAMLGDVTGELLLSERDAVTLLIDECATHGYEVATVGMQSNIAAALERDPGFAHTLPHLTVMGGVFAPIDVLGNSWPPAVDHNLNVDQPASLQALNAGIPAMYVPCDVTFGTWLTQSHLVQLRKGDELCRELARQIDIWTPHLHRIGGGIVPREYVALLHDPLAVACMLPAGRRFVTTHMARVTVAMHQGHVRTFIDPAAGSEAEIVDSVDAAAFAEFWLATVLG